MKLLISLGAERPRGPTAVATVATIRSRILGYCWPNAKRDPKYCHVGSYTYMREHGYPKGLDILLIGGRNVEPDGHSMGTVEHSIVVKGTQIMYDMACHLNALHRYHKNHDTSFDGTYYRSAPDNPGQPILGKVTARELKKEAAKADAFSARADVAVKRMRTLLLDYARGAQTNAKNRLYACYRYVKDHGYNTNLCIRLLVDRDSENTHAVVTELSTLRYDGFRHLDDPDTPSAWNARTSLNLPNDEYEVNGRLTGFKAMGYVAADELKAVDPDYSRR